jgi:uncharacterized protein YbgA (DUF1722 family)
MSNMNNLSPTDKEVELEEISNQYWADLCECLKRLEKNEDFKAVIMEGYFKDRALDSVSLLATDYVKRSGTRPNVMENLVAISTLQNYFHTIKTLGEAPLFSDDEEEGN